ncbi:MAG: methyl-accepting chemotaxis protein [Spirochaetaceae bacterium]|nr:methyl-accepting chemotaxis protein [Spirochaetaceae bacterium]
MRKKFKNVRIRIKLLIGFACMSVIGLILGITGLLSISSLIHMSYELNKLQMESKNLSEVLNKHFIWRQNLTETMLYGSKFTGALSPETCSLGIWLNEGEGKAVTDESILSMLNSIAGPHAYMHHEAAVILKLLESKGTDAAKTHFIDNLLPSMKEVIIRLDQMKERYAKLIDDMSIDILERGRFLSILIVAFILAAIIAGAILSMLMPPVILKPITVLSSFMKQAADGDFSKRVKSDFSAEITQLFDACNALVIFSDTSVLNLTETVIKVRKSAQDMLSVSSQMASNSQALNEETSSVSTAAEEFSAGMAESSSSLSTASVHISAVATSIEQINATISSVAAAAEETSTRSKQSSALVDNIQDSISKASGSVTLVSNAFNSVAQSVDEINRSILTVSEHCAVTKNKMSDADDKAKNTNMIIQRLEIASKQIGKIVNVINDIADQTNMLALNAAIEAAGAGEAGKGFMVVANEVKELAKQTATATDEIADQIENMQKNMTEAVGAVSEITELINEMTGFMNSFTSEMTQQGKRSDQIADESAAAARRMNEITTEINKLSENALSVTKTVVESAKGANEIAKSTAELVIGAQEIGMNSERVSNNIKEIDRTAKEMVSGLVDISKNIQLINEKTSAVQNNADATKSSSEGMMEIANDMEVFISKFKTT